MDMQSLLSTLTILPSILPEEVFSARSLLT